MGQSMGSREKRKGGTSLDLSIEGGRLLWLGKRTISPFGEEEEEGETTWEKKRVNNNKEDKAR